MVTEPTKRSCPIRHMKMLEEEYVWFGSCTKITMAIHTTIGSMITVTVGTSILAMFRMVILRDVVKNLCRPCVTNQQILIPATSQISWEISPLWVVNATTYRWLIALWFVSEWMVKCSTQLHSHILVELTEFDFTFRGIAASNEQVLHKFYLNVNSLIVIWSPDSARGYPLKLLSLFSTILSTAENKNDWHASFVLNYVTMAAFIGHLF